MPDAAWITIGYISTDAGLLLLLAVLILSGLAVRRARTSHDAAAVGGRGVLAAASLTSFLVLMYGVAIWAMATKPV